MDGRHHSDDYLAARRAAARRRVGRQRIRAGAGLGLLAAIAVAVLALQLRGAGGDDQHRTLEPAAARVAVRGGAPPTLPIGVWRIPASDAEPPHRSIPIVMYHGAEAPPPAARSPDLWVPHDRFISQMLMLRASGYHAITLRAAYDYWKGRARVPSKPVVLTFDDGYRSQFTNAMPVLRRLGWPGVLNLEVGALRGNGPERITPEQVRGLVRAGWEIAAHTINHHDLTTLDADRLRYEIAEGRRQIARRFGVPVSFFCYPAGRYDAAVVREVKRAGFLGATTTNHGLGSARELYTLKRIRAPGSASTELLRRRLVSAR